MAVAEGGAVNAWAAASGLLFIDAEILALANALQRPIHVFEPVAACNGTEFRLQLCGAFGSPRFDASGKPVCIVAADDRFPSCKTNRGQTTRRGRTSDRTHLMRTNGSSGAFV
jgi:hypothetical protein